MDIVKLWGQALCWGHLRGHLEDLFGGLILTTRIHSFGYRKEWIFLFGACLVVVFFVSGHA